MYGQNYQHNGYGYQQPQQGYAPQQGYQQPMQQPRPVAQDISLDEMMSGGTPSAFDKNTPLGTSVTGEIIEIHAEQQRNIQSGEPLFWDDGKAKQQIVITLQTTLRDPNIQYDNGQRRVYVKQGANAKALKAASLAAGVGNYPRVGDTLTAKFDHTTPSKQRGFNDRKDYTYVVVPGDPNRKAMDEMMNDPQNAPQSGAYAPNPAQSYSQYPQAQSAPQGVTLNVPQQPAPQQQPAAPQAPRVNEQQVLQLHAAGKSVPEIQTLTGFLAADIQRIVAQAAPHGGSEQEPEF
ncbi:hypothetical protein [Bifidobacterium aerophilum]|uniref:Uncharacterized protein n=1 Tax=Bifidobacterium aerophilum TaxID=1798155 RepID=A0A6N9Z832_9BIFI|nr:hypothetical protein [Bifidobacterium aerophilum]NEG90586.1 hypothetical protein [Bifidobacterium aerophilum]